MARFKQAIQFPSCPLCGEPVGEVRWEAGLAVIVPYEGTALGTSDEVAWAMSRPGAQLKPSPDFDVITLKPCDHVLSKGMMTEYRNRLDEARSAAR